MHLMLSQSSIDRAYRDALLAVHILSRGRVESAQSILLGAGYEDASMTVLLDHHLAPTLHSALPLPFPLSLALALAIALSTLALALAIAAFALLRIDTQVLSGHGRL